MPLSLNLDDLDSKFLPNPQFNHPWLPILPFGLMALHVSTLTTLTWVRTQLVDPMSFVSWDVTIRIFQDGEGVTPANYSTVVAAAERDKRTKYSFIPNGVQRPGLLVPLVFSPLGYVSDETDRLSGVDTQAFLSTIAEID